MRSRTRRRRELGGREPRPAAPQNQEGRGMTRQSSWSKYLVAVGMVYGGTVVGQEPAKPLAELVRAATEQYKDPAAAVAAGYAPMACVSGPTSGAMGVHYVNVDFLQDGVVDVTKPEALMYEPQADGTLDLLGVEFIIFTGPTVLDGHLFHFVGAPNR